MHCNIVAPDLKSISLQGRGINCLIRALGSRPRETVAWTLWDLFLRRSHQDVYSLGAIIYWNKESTPCMNWWLSKWVYNLGERPTEFKIGILAYHTCVFKANKPTYILSNWNEIFWFTVHPDSPLFFRWLWTWISKMSIILSNSKPS